MSETFFGLNISLPLWISVLVVAVLILLAGAMAGLILCVFSLDVRRITAISLQVPPTAENEKAKRILSIITEPHWLMITLLTWNDIALEMMPLVLNTFLNPVVAVVFSVFFTLAFCEILPQAIFIHNAFSISAILAPFIRVLMWITSPIAWPIGKLLNSLVGNKEAVFFQRRELREVIRYQDALRKRNKGGETGESDDEQDEDDLTEEEMTIMLNVLSLSESTAKEMLKTPIGLMYTLHIDAVITLEIVERIASSNFNFIPIYEDADDPSEVTSILMTKALALLVYSKESDRIRVRDLPLLRLERFRGSMSGTEVFNKLHTLSPR
ncbi:hypothetical protein AGDE_02013 [Angomonas deanei]|nr:hypothetical protein AGDE_02013 [Angomonas deanei]|eukprot:EPY41910.1 hypothetical protein AGDE_02013 [Angomonas deanei]